MKSQKLVHLGVPKYIGSGSFEIGDCKYRFMIMDRFGQDVEKLFLESSKKFPLQTVFSLGLRMVRLNANFFKFAQFFITRKILKSPQIDKE